jgi:hypothetical protein
VKINSGGSAGSGVESQPEAPDDAREAEVHAPEAPKPEDTGLAGAGQ